MQYRRQCMLRYLSHEGETYCRTKDVTKQRRRCLEPYNSYNKRKKKNFSHRQWKPHREPYWTDLMLTSSALTVRTMSLFASPSPKSRVPWVGVMSLFEFDGSLCTWQKISLKRKHIRVTFLSRRTRLWQWHFCSLIQWDKITLWCYSYLTTLKKSWKLLFR